MKNDNKTIILLNLVFIYMDLSFAYYQAVALGLADKEPELFERQRKALEDMREVIFKEFESMRVE